MEPVLQHLQELRSADHAAKGPVARKGIGWFSAAYLVVASIATWVAVRDGLAGRPFGWDLGVEPLPGFVFGPGTALSAPLVMLSALVLANILLRRGGRAAPGATAAIWWLGAGFTIGMLAEPVTWDPATWDGGPLAAIVLANLILPLALVILASTLRGLPAVDSVSRMRDGDDTEE